MKNKSLSLFTFLILCLIFLMSCADVNYTRTYDSKSGEIADTINIKLDTNKLPAHTLADLDTAIVDDFSNYIIAVKNVESVRVKTHIDKENYHYTLTTTFKDVQTLLQVYKNKDIGPFAFYIANSKSFPWASEYSPFLYKYQPVYNKSILEVIKYRTPPAQSKTIFDRYSEVVGEESTQMMDELKISQSFVTDIDRLYTNAHTVQKDHSTTTYTWQLNNQPVNFELHMYHLLAKPTAWYVVAIISTCVLVVGMIIFMIFKSKKENKKQV